MTSTHDPADDAGQPGERHAPLPPAQVEDLVERAVEAVVSTPSADTVLALVDDLDRGAALWDGAQVLLGPMAARPLPGLGEQEAVVRLHRLADTVDAVSSLTYSLWAEFREHGAAAARAVWDVAPLKVRRGAAAQMLIVYCQTIGGDAGTLAPRDTVRLIGATVPVTW